MLHVELKGYPIIYTTVKRIIYIHSHMREILGGKNGTK